jgi:hypothetical protein
MQIQVARIQRRVPEYGWTIQKVFQFLNFVVNAGTLFNLLCRKKIYMLHFLRLDANFTALQICSQVLYLCLPSPGAASEPSGLHALTFSFNINDKFHLINHS